MASTTGLEERHVVVTGAGRGIGRAIAERLARDGARLTLLGRHAGRLEAAAAALAGARAAPCDIRDREQVDSALDDAVAAGGPLYALVANSGVGGANEPGAADRWDDLVTTNLSGTYWCFRAAERHVVEGGRLIAISSILARIGVSGYTGYCASKAGILGLVRALAAELAPRSVAVNAICPGWVDTSMAWEGLDALCQDTGSTLDDAYADAMRDVPLGRMSDADEIAGTVAWLLSHDARNVTGQAIDHNGGAWMG